MALQFSDADHETLSAAENSKRTTLPDRQPIATEFPETAAVPSRHSAGSQSKSVPAVVTQVLSRKPSPETIKDCDGMAGFKEDITSPVKEKTPAPKINEMTSLHTPVFAFQIRTVLSLEADATIIESCENTTDLTSSLWPSSTCLHFPVFAFQIRTVLSQEADATIVESCENTTELT
ncbi:hypothetical protein MRS44_003815 [Fusarium solani]|uniref:uncharacterized protein n=1 Tax=Fusarium solani TaxID=169388 RepID=UPI0032C48D0C|nr:hypothetical protein MRS44_003815 [Fusarium solani]